MLAHRTLLPLHSVHATSLFLVVCVASVGCQPFSRFAYRCGRALDPAVQSCQCGAMGNPMGVPDAVIPAQYAESTAGETIQLRTETEQLRREVVDLRQRLDQMTEDNLRRNDALIAARGEVARLSAELATMQQELQNWQGEMKRFRETLVARNADRLREIRELAAALERLNDRYQQ